MGLSAERHSDDSDVPNYRFAVPKEMFPASPRVRLVLILDDHDEIIGDAKVKVMEWQ